MKNKLLKIFFSLVLLVGFFVFAPSAFAADRYWVGNGGAFRDTAHWSTTTGGSGGASYPTSVDNVHVDANSLTLDGQQLWWNRAGTDSINDIDFTGATHTPSVSFGNTGTFFIYGNVTFISAMTFPPHYDYYNTAVVLAGTGKTITSAGVNFVPSYLVTLNITGSYTLNDDLILNTGTAGTIYVTSGTLDTNGKTVSAQNLVINGGTLTLGTSTVNSPVSISSGTLNANSSIINSSSWTSTGGTVNSGTSSIRVSGTGAFAGGGKTYSEVQLNGSAHTISGSNINN